MHKNTKIILGLAGACVIILAGLFYMLRHSGNAQGGALLETDVFAAESTETDGSDASDGETEEARTFFARVCVYVCGQVASPGLYYLEDGARVAQAFEAAGGLLPDADISAINPAAYASDGQKIYVPAFGESAAYITETEDFGGHTSGMININTADEALLSTLPGIGKVKAQSIVAYREENGGFKAVEDIKNVTGIKDSSYDRIKDLICV